MSDSKNKNDEIERPIIDVVFQMGVLKLALQDDYFCLQLVKYLADDNDLDEYLIFDNEGLQVIFKIIVDSVQTFKNRPTEGQVRQKISELPEGERQDFNELLDTVLQQDTHNEDYYRKFLQTYIQTVKMAKGFKKTRKIFKERPETSYDFMQSVIDSIRRVAFDKEDVVTLKDLPGLITEGAALNSRKIPTGIKELDADLVGGLPRENLTVVLAGTNVGKSLFCISLACNAMKAVDESGQNKGFKVLHVNLEGQRDEAAKRYAANLAQIGYGDLIRGSFDEAARRRFEEVVGTYDENRLIIRNMLGFGATIEDLYAYCKEVYKSFRFDLLVVDYGQLLDSKVKTEGHRFTMSRVFRGLDAISKEFSCVVVTPAQSTRNAQENQNQMFKGRNSQGQSEDRGHILRSTDISEAFEIARVSGVILTLNRTEEEERTSRLRVFLEKQRQGAKNKLYGLVTNYSQSNLITGKTYNPFEVVIEANAVEGKKPEKGAGLSSIKHLTDAKQNQILSAKKQDKEEEVDGPIKFIDKLSQEYYTVRDELARITSSYNDLREQDDYDTEEMDKFTEAIEILKSRINEILSEARSMIGQAYPDANKEQYTLIKKQLEDLRRSGGNSAEIQKIERIVRHYEVGLGLVRGGN